MVSLDDKDDFILVNDDILDEFQQVVFGKREAVPDSLSATNPYTLPVQEDPFQLDVFSPSWDPSLFLYDDDEVHENDCPFTSFSIPVGDNIVY